MTLNETLLLLPQFFFVFANLFFYFSLSLIISCFVVFMVESSKQDLFNIAGPASVGTVDMNDMSDMNGGLETGDLPAHMDTTDDLVPTLDVRKHYSSEKTKNKSKLILIVFSFLNSWEKSYRLTS